MTRILATTAIPPVARRFIGGAASAVVVALFVVAGWSCSARAPESSGSAVPTDAEDTAVVAAESVGDAMRFAAIDVRFDVGRARLAAWQFELRIDTDDETRAEIVGIEGGEHSAFRDAPFFDERVVGDAVPGLRSFAHEGRVVVAAFDTGEDLPSGLTRLSRVHLLVKGSGEPRFNVRVLAAANADGESIDAIASTAPSRVEAVEEERR